MVELQAMPDAGIDHVATSRCRSSSATVSSASSGGCRSSSARSSSRTSTSAVPISEVAEILGIPVGTAKSRLNRGLQALRIAFDAEPRPRPTPIPVRTP